MVQALGWGHAQRMGWRQVVGRARAGEAAGPRWPWLQAQGPVSVAGAVQPVGSLPRSQGSGVPVEVLLGCDVSGAVPSSWASWPGSQPLAGSLDFLILFLESCVTYIPSRSQYGETGVQASSCNYRPASAVSPSEIGRAHV